MEAATLNLLWVGPLVGGLVGLFLHRKGIKLWIIIHGLLQFFLWGYLYWKYEGLGPVQEIPWFSIQEKSFYYHISIRPSNLWLLFLTILVGHSAMLYACSYVSRLRSFTVLFFFTIAFIQGVFLAGEVIIFFIFYEASLVPAFLLIYGWGSEGRRLAAVKFALFTLGGSVLLLVGILWGLSACEGGKWLDWQRACLPAGAWWLMSLGLAVKLPLIPLHAWLGDAHVEAEAPVSMLLAALLLKLGGYGLLNWVWRGEYAFILRIWGGLSLLYATGVAMAQQDLKRLIAFTSIAHMGLVAIGAGAQSHTGLQGAYHQLFTHGLVSAGLFAWIGYLEKKTGERNLSSLQGILYKDIRSQLPAILLFFSAIGVPGSSLFISELLIIWGTGEGAGWLWAFVPALSLLLTAIYFLRAYRDLAKPNSTTFISLRSPSYLPELIVWILLFISFLSGILPSPWLKVLAHAGY
ncbi:MAG: NADH-quinone oxidoreductase subunit M [Bacteroidia bacterium]|nr:NADH-quinone oxidoreductase subunit M [Bacteroidia bacterium]MDW8133801.1 NADH-quinone oxidoreductase subunit M [Bacteroidia bacterium]